MHTVFALLCFVVVIHWLVFSYPSGLLHWHCGNLTIAPVPAKQPWWIWIKTSCEFIMNDCVTTTKQSTTKPCAYFLGYTVTTHCYPLNHSRCCQCGCFVTLLPITEIWGWVPCYHRCHYHWQWGACYLYYECTHRQTIFANYWNRIYLSAVSNISGLISLLILRLLW